MTYYFATTINDSFENAITRVTRELANEGFGVITEIDVTGTFAKKLGKAFRPYRILGACNPQYAFQALSTEDKIGTMLPCNVIVQELAPGKIEVATVDPISSMQAVPNESLAQLAMEVRDRLGKVIAALEQ